MPAKDVLFADLTLYLLPVGEVTHKPF